MHIAFVIVPDHRFVIVASAVYFGFNAQRPVDLQFESDRTVD